jgi:uncharacterized 2Fe-2S/4Fe-4S cluster protein (DUF4445 family)
LIRVLLNPINQELRAEVGDILLDRMREEGIHIESLCGGKGLCGKCKVILEKGSLKKKSTSGTDKLLSKEEIEQRYHLACMVRLIEDCTFTIPTESRIENPKILLSAELELPEVKPSISKHLVELLNEGGGLLTYRHLNLQGYQGTTPRIPEGVYDKIKSITGNTLTATVTRTRGHPEIVNLEKGDTTSRNFGLAIDIGTTTIVAVLADVKIGKILSTSSGLNKQITFGEDLVTRVAVSGKKGGLKKLQKAVVTSINEVLASLYSDVGVDPSEVTDVCVGGNTVMAHLFAGLDSTYLEIANVDVSRDPIIVKGSEIGLNINPEAYVFCIPNVSRYLGGDAVADVITSGMHSSEETSLVVDLGTNGEIIFGNNKWLFSCSCASGPAFEGQGIRHGMRAAIGGIEHVKIDHTTKKANLSVIGDVLPKGICGSGLIDLLAEIFRVGVMDFVGKFIPSSPNVRRGNWGLEYIVAPAVETGIGKDIVLTQADLDYVIDSKAAACGAITVLMKKLKVSIYDVKNIYLAGAFGTYTSIESATRLGIFPEFPNGKYHNIGNGSLSGAYSTLMSMGKRREASEVAKRMMYVDLLVDNEFIEEYSKALYIPGASEYFPSPIEERR